MKRKRLAVLLNQLEGRYQSSVWRGVADVAAAAGADLFLFPGKSPGSTDPDEIRHTVLYDLVDPALFDGFVMASGVLSNYIGVDGFLEFSRPFRQKPLVSISLELPGIPAVMIDNASGMRALAEHCVRYHGYRRIAFVRGPATNIEAELRHAAFLEVLAENGLAADPALVLQGDFTRASGEAAMRRLWEGGGRPEIVIFANDDMAYAAYAWARRQGIRIPEDVAMAGFDDIEEMRYLPAPFTTVSQPSYDQAALACRHLLRLLEGEEVPLVTRLPTQLVIRQSCGCDRERPLPLPDIEPAPRQCALLRDRAVGAAEEFILPILQQLDVPDILGQTFRDDARRLLQALGRDCEEGTSSHRFEEVLEAILSACPEQGLFLDYLAQLFRILRAEVLDVHGNPVTRAQFELVLQRVMLLGRGHTIWREAGRRLRLEYLSWYLRGVNQRLSLSMEPDKLYPMIATELRGLGIAAAALAVYVRATLGDGSGVLPELRLVCAYGPEGELPDCGAVYPSRALLPEPLLCGPTRQGLIIMPLFSGEVQLGVLAMEAGGIEDTLYETLRVTISDALVIAILFQEHRAQAAQLSAANRELEGLNRRLHELSQRDELTGLYNRRGFMALAEHEFRTAKRRGVPLVLFFIDLDGLKWINDELGHEHGDAAISGAAAVLRQSFRETDILARLGGDEFVVLATGADAAFGAEARARLYAELEIWNGREARPFMLALSMGIAVYGPERTDDLDGLLAEADMLLYRDKEERERLGLRRGRGEKNAKTS